METLIIKEKMRALGLYSPRRKRTRISQGSGWIDCDNGIVVISGETNQSFNEASNGNFVVIVNVV